MRGHSVLGSVVTAEVREAVQEVEEQEPAAIGSLDAIVEEQAAAEGAARQARVHSSYFLTTQSNTTHILHARGNRCSALLPPLKSTGRLLSRDISHSRQS